MGESDRQNGYGFHLFDKAEARRTGPGAGLGPRVARQAAPK